MLRASATFKLFLTHISHVASFTSMASTIQLYLSSTKNWCKLHHASWSTTVRNSQNHMVGSDGFVQALHLTSHSNTTFLYKHCRSFTSETDVHEDNKSTHTCTIIIVLAHMLIDTHKMSNIYSGYGATQPLLCIVLETKALVFASLTSDRRQIFVRVCQHPAPLVQCKQLQVITQTTVSDHTAAYQAD